MILAILDVYKSPSPPQKSYNRNIVKNTRLLKTAPFFHRSTGNITGASPFAQHLYSRPDGCKPSPAIRLRLVAASRVAGVISM